MANLRPIQLLKHSGSLKFSSLRWHTCRERVCIHQLKAVGGLRSIYSRLADAPGAGAALAPAAVPLTGAGFTPAGLGDVELFGLNKRGNLSLNLRGVGDGTGVGVGLGDA